MSYDSPELGTGLVETTYTSFPHFGSEATYRTQAAVQPEPAYERVSVGHRVGRFAATVRNWVVAPVPCSVEWETGEPVFDDSGDDQDISVDTLEELREVWPRYDH